MAQFSMQVAACPRHTKGLASSSAPCLKDRLAAVEAGTAFLLLSMDTVGHAGHAQAPAQASLARYTQWMLGKPVVGIVLCEALDATMAPARDELLCLDVEQLDCLPRYLESARSVANPLLLKLNREVDPARLRHILTLLNPARQAGKIVLCVGASISDSWLGEASSLSGKHGLNVTWILDGGADPGQFQQVAARWHRQGALLERTDQFLQGLALQWQAGLRPARAGIASGFNFEQGLQVCSHVTQAIREVA
jgi:hypothetical protein